MGATYPTSIRIDHDLRQAIRTEAVRQNQSFQDYMIRCLEIGMERVKAQKLTQPTGSFTAVVKRSPPPRKVTKKK